MNGSSTPVSRRSVWILGLTLMSAVAVTSSRGHYERKGFVLYVLIAVLAWWIWRRLDRFSASSGKRWDLLLLFAVVVHIGCNFKRMLLSADNAYSWVTAPLTGLILGLVLFWKRSGMDYKNDWDTREDYSGFWYTLDLFIPIVNLQTANEWRPKENRSLALIYMRLHTLAGWILIPLGLAALTGIVG